MAGREKNCKWYFADQPNVQEVGPNNAMEQNFKHHPYASLVRESIQNSLDAVLDKSEPVRMEFSFKEMRGNEYPQFFELKNHIQGCIDYYPNNRNAKAIYEPMLKFIIRKSKFPQNPKRSVRFSGKRTKRSVQKRKARNTQKAETKVL